MNEWSKIQYNRKVKMFKWKRISAIFRARNVLDWNPVLCESATFNNAFRLRGRLLTRWCDDTIQSKVAIVLFIRRVVFEIRLKRRVIATLAMHVLFVAKFHAFAQVFCLHQLARTVFVKRFKCEVIPPLAKGVMCIFVFYNSIRHTVSEGIIRC